MPEPNKADEIQQAIHAANPMQRVAGTDTNDTGVRREPLRPGENPHSHNVSGYRTMSDQDVATINELKQAERETARMLARLSDYGGDPRCMAIARSRFEEAFMYLVKAIAKPADPYQEARAESTPPPESSP